MSADTFATGTTTADYAQALAAAEARGWQAAIDTMRDVFDRTGSGSARWAEDYLAGNPDYRDYLTTIAEQTPDAPSATQCAPQTAQNQPGVGQDTPGAQGDAERRMLLAEAPDAAVREAESTWTGADAPNTAQDSPNLLPTEVVCKCPPGLAYRCHHRAAPIGSTPRAGEPDLRAEVQHLTQERDEARIQLSVITDVAARMAQTFNEPGHPGASCLRTGWIDIDTVRQWKRQVQAAVDALPTQPSNDRQVPQPAETPRNGGTPSNETAAALPTQEAQP